MPVAPQHTFVVEHDWAKAFAATDEDFKTFRLPYDVVNFEFKFSGRHVCVLAKQEDERVYINAYIEFNDFGNYWFETELNIMAGLPPEFHGLICNIFAQIQAICVALDAEVATTEVVRAPHKLNCQREKKGKAPIQAFHVVKLARRSRAKPLPEDHEKADRNRPRMHFVRGHWKHYASHKTWTKWFLRGDSDLGFIDKGYRL